MTEVVKGITYDVPTGLYSMVLDGDELGTLRYALAHGVADLESRALFMRRMPDAQEIYETESATAQRARALSDRIEQDVKGAHRRV